MDEQLQKMQNHLTSSCKELSELRRGVAKQLAQRIVEELKLIGLENARFKIDFGYFSGDDDRSIKLDSGIHVKENGLDKIEFFVSTNPGEDFKPLVKVVSGGELSRIMLALKTVLAEKDQIEVLVFDEIDIGISGRIAEAVGRKLKELSKSHQIICVTHLPQIAGFADKHFSVRKQVQNGETFAFIHELNFEQRIQELAYLLGGEKITDAVLKNAEELLASSA
jgi:DNA repair protein RecN (Recombination protein N)